MKVQRSWHGAFLGSSLRAAVVATMAMPATAARENADVAVKTECAAWVVSVIVIVDGVVTRKDGGPCHCGDDACENSRSNALFHGQVQARVHRDAALQFAGPPRPKLQIYFWIGSTKLLVRRGATSNHFISSIWGERVTWEHQPLNLIQPRRPTNTERSNAGLESMHCH